MGFNPPDPKRIAGDRARIKRQRNVAIAIEKAAIKRKREVRACYHEHSPKQIAQAGEMMQMVSLKDRILSGKVGACMVIGTSKGKPLTCWRAVQ